MTPILGISRVALAEYALHHHRCWRLPHSVPNPFLLARSFPLRMVSEFVLCLGGKCNPFFHVVLPLWRPWFHFVLAKVVLPFQGRYPNRHLCSSILALSVCQREELPGSCVVDLREPRVSIFWTHRLEVDHLVYRFHVYFNEFTHKVKGESSYQEHTQKQGMPICVTPLPSNNQAD